MRKLQSVLTILLIALLLFGCGNSYQKQYDLGIRYLSDGNYEEAIIAFTAAIEIDAKRAEACIGLYDVYITQGDIDAAQQILQQGISITDDEKLYALLEELLETRSSALNSSEQQEILSEKYGLDFSAFSSRSRVGGDFDNDGYSEIYLVCCARPDIDDNMANHYVYYCDHDGNFTELVTTLELPVELNHSRAGRTTHEYLGFYYAVGDELQIRDVYVFLNNANGEPALAYEEHGLSLSENRDDLDNDDVSLFVENMINNLN